MSAEYVRDRRQRTLVAFLRAELAIGPTLVHSAALAKSAGHLAHAAAAKEKALKAADTVRHFVGQIADEKIRDEIGKRLTELDRLISEP
jgi:hypothetical protein